jgi:acetyl esterase/lipase
MATTSPRQLRKTYEHSEEIEGVKYHFAPLSLPDARRLKHLVFQLIDAQATQAFQESNVLGFIISLLKNLDPETEQTILELVALGAAVEEDGIVIHLSGNGPVEQWVLSHHFATIKDMARQFGFLVQGVQYNLAPFFGSLGTLVASQASPSPTTEG